MGYFSNLAIDSWDNYYDVSWTTHEQQLLWRWEDLQSLLDEMRSWGAPYSGSVTYTDDELRYMLPEHPGGHSLRKNGTIRDVEKALELTAQELKEKYGIDIQPEKAEEPELDELTGNQLSFLLILPPLATQYENTNQLELKAHIKTPTLADTIVSNKGRYYVPSRIQ